MGDLERLKRRLERERLARKEAERLLEQKSLELFLANERLRELTSKLKDQVEERTEQLVKVNEALDLESSARRIAQAHAEEASQVKEGFLAVMSHELRTPLNAIIGYTELIQEEAQLMGATDFLPDTRKIHDASNHLLGLVEAILDLSSDAASPSIPDPAAFTVQDLVEEVTQAISSAVKHNCNELAVTYERIEMHTDRKKLSRILRHLLANAAKFTHNGSVELLVKRDASGEHELCVITIRDTGIGIHEELLEKIFEPFTQEDSSYTRRYAGTGLGLAVTRKLCTQLGGDIEVQSISKMGTTFTVRVPTRLPTAI